METLRCEGDLRLRARSNHASGMLNSIRGNLHQDIPGVPHPGEPGIKDARLAKQHLEKKERSGKSKCRSGINISRDVEKKSGTGILPLCQSTKQHCHKTAAALSHCRSVTHVLPLSNLLISKSFHGHRTYVSSATLNGQVRNSFHKPIFWVLIQKSSSPDSDPILNMPVPQRQIQWYSGDSEEYKPKGLFWELPMFKTLYAGLFPAKSSYRYIGVVLGTLPQRGCAAATIDISVNVDEFGAPGKVKGLLSNKGLHMGHH
ncbi:hypothetical protein DFH06DRAFT_1148287 [Mycena polygramma]|nr:hypothetical protein DFH06DRAFT_1148287 [Mycena polygramma]